MAMIFGLAGLAYQLALGLHMVLMLPAPNPGVPIMMGSVITGAVLATVGSLTGLCIDLKRVFLASSIQDR